MKPQVIEALRNQLGQSKVHTTDDILDERRFDYWVVSHLRDWRGETLERPGVVVRPESPSEVQTIVRIASETQTPIVPFGLGSGVCGGIKPNPSMGRNRAIPTRSAPNSRALALMAAAIAAGSSTVCWTGLTGPSRLSPNTWVWRLASTISGVSLP